MADLNSWAFSGCLSKDAVVKDVNGKKLVEMSVAQNNGFGDYKYTNWITVKWWGERAAKAAQYFTKGTLVTGAGAIKPDTYTGNDGVQHTNLVVTVSDLQKLRNAKDQTNQTTGSSESIEDMPEDIPY